jgi:hypothetical protein
MKNNSDSSSSYQNSARSYLKVYKSVQNNLNNNSIYQENSNGMDPTKNDIIRWFFSLPIESRIKIATVEGSWIVRMLYQMFLQYKKDNYIVFQMKCDNSSSDQTYFPLFTYTVVNDIDNYKNEDYQHTNILNYFSFMSHKSHFDLTMIERLFIKEICFFSVHNGVDCFSIRPKVLLEENLFIHYFNELTKNKCFTHLIEPFNDTKNKIYNYNMPAWFNYNNYYSIGQYIAAFIEQTIIIKYVLNYKKNCSKISYSLIDDSKLNSVFEKRKEIIKFLHESKGVQNDLKVETIYNEIMRDKNITGLININNRQYEKGGHSSLISKKLSDDDPLFLINKLDIENIIQIKKVLKIQDAIELTDILLFYSINYIWKHDYYIGTRLFEELLTTYTEKNALDLITEHEQSSKTSKKKKKSITKETKVEYDFYATYQQRIGNKRASLVQNSSPAPMTNYYRENLNLKYDIAKNILLDIIEKAILKGKENLIKKASYLDFLEDLSQINLKGKIINNILNDNNDENTDSLKSEGNNGSTNNENKSVHSTDKEEDNNNISGNENNNNIDESNNIQNPENQANINSSNEAKVQGGNQKKKREKEVKIFLYDTTKGKKKNSKLVTTVTPTVTPTATNTINISNINNKKNSERQNAYSNSPKSSNRKTNTINSPKKDKEKSNTPKISRLVPNYNSLYININPKELNYNRIQPAKISNTDFITFVHKLHNDIVSYYNDVYTNLQLFKEIKTYTVNYVKEIITKYIDNAVLDIYGSFATDLSIESSDIDIKIKLSSNTFDNEKVIILLTNAFNNLNIFNKIVPIFTASVPVIKLVSLYLYA